MKNINIKILKQNLSMIIASKRWHFCCDDVFDVIQSWFGLFCICFIVFNTFLDIIEPKVSSNAVLGCTLCLNWIIFSWRVRSSYAREISRLPRWVNIFYYIYPLFLFVPLCAVILGNYVFQEFHISFHCLWVSFIAVLIAFMIDGKDNEDNASVVEAYVLVRLQGKEDHYG